MFTFKYNKSHNKSKQGDQKMANERYALNKQLAQMLKGGVIMDVTTPEQAKIAEEAGACAVMALERIPADIRAAGGVARMSDPKMIQEIQAAVSIPVMAKQLKLIILMKVKFYHQLMMFIMSTKENLKYHLFVELKI